MKMSRLEEQVHGSFFWNTPPSWTRQSNRLTFHFLVFCSLLTQSHKVQGFSRITFCYNKNNYEGETKDVLLRQ